MKKKNFSLSKIGYENIFGVENNCKSNYSKDIKRNTKTNSRKENGWGQKQKLKNI